MEIKEVIDHITHHAFIADCVKDISIAALEKQIPKKPLQYEHDYICLCCGYVLAESVDDNCDLEEEMAGWCPYCGQKIDLKVEK